jgi:hypothetical protein
MRTHLLRIVLDHAWRFSAEGNELYLGVGWFVTFWLLAMLLGWFGNPVTVWKLHFR